MLEKKLLTLGCAIGIVVCGACYLPTPPRVRPLPPSIPPAIDLSGYRRIIVGVTNVSQTRHLDPVIVSRWIAQAINRQRQPGIPVADAGGQARPGDAVLQVSILKESAVPGPTTQAQTPSDALVEVTIDATLTGPNGNIVWRELNQPYRSIDRLHFSDAADPWSSRTVERWVHFYFCRTLVSQILNGDE